MKKRGPRRQILLQKMCEKRLTKAVLTESKPVEGDVVAH